MGRLMFQVSDFREHQDCGPIIADKIWQAWWRNAGHSLADVERHLTEIANGRLLPMAVVAHDREGYAGSAFIIHSDLDERPQYGPWIAALWVEAAKRKRGVGRALVAEAAKAARNLGHAEAYVCCARELERFYSDLGWTVIEQAVGKNGLSILKLNLVSS